MNIAKLIIRNYLSFDNTEILFENYTVIVGPNASGKTNLVRFLKFLSDKTTTIDDKRLDINSKFDKGQPSSLWVDILLNKYETKILFQLLFNKKITDLLPETRISVILEWKNIYDNEPPNLIILYFSNKLMIWQDNSAINISYARGVPTAIEDLKSEIIETTTPLENDELKNNYRDEHGFSHQDLFAQPLFQNAFQTGGAIEDFLSMNSNRFRIQKNDFSVEYKSGATNDEKEPVAEIFRYLAMDPD